VANQSELRLQAQIAGGIRKEKLVKKQVLAHRESFQLSPVQGPPGVWAAWPQRSGHVCSFSLSWPLQLHNTWDTGRGGIRPGWGQALTPPILGLPLGVEGPSGVQQQEELSLSLGTVPCKEIVLQRDRSGNRADHIDLTTLQPPKGRRQSGCVGRSPHLHHFPHPL
jgi:hypothetical protein